MLHDLVLPAEERHCPTLCRVARLLCGTGRFREPPPEHEEEGGDLRCVTAKGGLLLWPLLPSSASQLLREHQGTPIAPILALLGGSDIFEDKARLEEQVLVGLRGKGAVTGLLEANICRGLAALERLLRHQFRRLQCTGTWIIKPSQCNGGVGLHIVNARNWLLEWLRMKQAFTQQTTFVVQRYIEQPALWEDTGRKYHLRVFGCMVGDGEGGFTSHLFPQAFAHLSNERFSMTLEPSSKAFPVAVHLTNVAQNARNSDLFDGYRVVNLEQASWAEVWRGMQGVSAAVFDAASPHLKCLSSAFDFQLLGVDFLLDAEATVHLLEINCPPCMGTQTQGDARLCDGVHDSYLMDLLEHHILPVLEDTMYARDDKPAATAKLGAWQPLFPSLASSLPCSRKRASQDAEEDTDEDRSKRKTRTGISFVAASATSSEG